MFCLAFAHDQFGIRPCSFRHGSSSVVVSSGDYYGSKGQLDDLDEDPEGLNKGKQLNSAMTQEHNPGNELSQREAAS